MTDCFVDVQGLGLNHAVFLTNAALRVGGASSLTGSISFAIGGTGTVRVDPSVSIRRVGRACRTRAGVTWMFFCRGTVHTPGVLE